MYGIQGTQEGKEAKSQLNADYKKRKEFLDKEKTKIENQGKELDRTKSIISKEELNRRQEDLRLAMSSFQNLITENQKVILEREKQRVLISGKLDNAI